jgi:hypothetical protein
LVMSSITTRAWRPRSRSRKYSAIVKPANGATHCKPGAPDGLATMKMQRSEAPLAILGQSMISCALVA